MSANRHLKAGWMGLVAAVWLLAGCAGLKPNTDTQALRDEVGRVELAFADTMARRDLAAFASFIDEEAVFLNGGKPLRGKEQVVAHWKQFYEGPRAPFSWKPDQVEVVASGDLAQSIGPVFDPEGKLVARFYSTWRRVSPGVWRIVFDNGYGVKGTTDTAP
jgi:ketosteroid isomerase-like protein